MHALCKPIARTPYALAALVSAASLGAAYIAQYGFGLHPCELCLLQRVPYGVVIALSVIALVWPRRPLWLLALIALLFLGESGIASYHSLVEKHWIPGPTACTSSDASPGDSVDDFLARIKQAPIVACDAPAWEFHGITMAVMNAVWSLLLAVGCFVATQHFYRKGNADA
jgi:disulfide bond formation protein DsbB